MTAEIYGKVGHDSKVLQTWTTESGAGDPYRLGTTSDKLEFKTNGAHFINRIQVWWSNQWGQIAEMSVIFANEY